MVNDAPISLRRLDRQVPQERLREIRALVPRLRDASLRCARRRHLPAAIDEELQEQRARAMQLEVTPAEVQQALVQVQAQGRMTAGQFWQAVKASGGSKAKYEEHVRRALLRGRLVQAIYARPRELRGLSWSERRHLAGLTGQKRMAYVKRLLLRELRHAARITIYLRRAPSCAAVRASLPLSPLLREEDLRTHLGASPPYKVGELKGGGRWSGHSSIHFEATGRSETYDVALRVWRHNRAALKQRYLELRRKISGSRPVDQVADRSFSAGNPTILAHAFMDHRRSAVVLLTCGTKLCKDHGAALRIARLVHSRLHRLRLPRARATSPATGLASETSPGRAGQRNLMK